MSVYLHGYQLSINGTGFLPGADLPGSGKNMSSLLFLSLTHTHPSFYLSDSQVNAPAVERIYCISDCILYMKEHF